MVGEKDGMERRKAAQACREMERMRRDIKKRARKRVAGEIMDFESGLKESEDDGDIKPAGVEVSGGASGDGVRVSVEDAAVSGCCKCVKELATVDHIKIDDLVEPSSNNDLFRPSSKDKSTNVDPSLSAYEILWESNIQQNHGRLKALGFLPEQTSPNQTKKKKRQVQPPTQRRVQPKRYVKMRESTLESVADEVKQVESDNDESDNDDNNNNKRIEDHDNKDHDKEMQVESNDNESDKDHDDNASNEDHDNEDHDKEMTNESNDNTSNANDSSNQEANESSNQEANELSFNDT